MASTLSKRKATEGGKWFLLGTTACPLEGTHPPLLVHRNAGPAPWGSYPQTCMVALFPFCPVGPTLFPALQECPSLNLTLHERKEQSSAPFTGEETEA